MSLFLTTHVIICWKQICSSENFLDDLRTVSEALTAACLD